MLSPSCYPKLYACVNQNTDIRGKGTLPTGQQCVHSGWEISNPSSLCMLLYVCIHPRDGQSFTWCALQQKQRMERKERRRRRKARKVFDLFDADGSGTISMGEMKVSLLKEKTSGVSLDTVRGDLIVVHEYRMGVTRLLHLCGGSLFYPVLGASSGRDVCPARSSAAEGSHGGNGQRP